MATPGMDFGGGGRGGLNMMLAGGLPGGGSIQDLIAQLQGRLGGGGDLRSPMRGGPAPPPMIAQPVGPPRRFGPPGQVGGQGVPVIAFKGRPGGGDQDSNQMPTPDRPPSPGRGMLPYKEPPAPEPQEAAPQGAPEVPGGTDDDFRRIAAPQGAPGGPRQAPPRAAPPRPQLAQKPAEVPGGPQTNLPPGIREAPISAQKPARKPPGVTGQLGQAVGGMKGDGLRDNMNRVPNSGLMNRVPNPGLRGPDILARKPARKPAGGGNQLSTKPAEVPGWQQAGFDSRREAAQAAKAAGHEGSLRSFVQSQLGGGDEGQLATKPAQVPGGLVQMTPEKLWAIQNAPPWAQKMGAGADEVLRFIRNNPDSPIAQKYAAAGLG